MVLNIFDGAISIFEGALIWHLCLTTWLVEFQKSLDPHKNREKKILRSSQESGGKNNAKLLQRGTEPEITMLTQTCSETGQANLFEVPCLHLS